MAIRRSEKPGRKGQFAPAGDVSSDRPQERARTYWDEEARRIVRAEMERRQVSYKELSQLLADQNGTPSAPPYSERNLISRVSRGSFTFAFALELLRAMQVDSLNVEAVKVPRVIRRFTPSGDAS